MIGVRIFLNERVVEVISHIASYLPLSHLNLVLRSIESQHLTLLDVGCGRGGIMQLINGRTKIFSVGAEIFLPYLKECQSRDTHDAYVLCDSRTLPFKDGSFDAVLCIEVVEHLPKLDGFDCLNDMERIARDRVIVSSPVGAFPQEEYDGNPSQLHRSIWFPAEFEKLGYRVRGQGQKSLERAYTYCRGGPRTCGPRPYTAFTTVLTVLSVAVYYLRFLSYFYPNLAYHMVCVKKIQRIPEKI